MLFGWYRHATGERLCYEERLVLLNAVDFDDAWAKAELEADTYAKEPDRNDWRTRLESIVDVYRTFETELRSEMEVYSICRKSNLDLDPDQFLNRFYADHFEEPEPQT